MKSTFQSIFIIVLLSISLSSQGQSTEVSSVTWSQDINIGDTFQWDVVELLEDNQAVTNYTDYGVVQGSVIQIEVLVQLSDEVIQFEDFPDNLPEVDSLIKLTIDGVKRDFLSFYVGYFIIPVKLNLTSGGRVNAFVASLTDDEFKFLSDNKRLEGEEYVESNSTGNYAEEMRWETTRGLLNRVSINDTNFAFTLERRDQGLTRERNEDNGLLPLPMRAAILGLVFIVIFYRNRPKKKL